MRVALEAVWAWILANPELVVAIALGIIANVAPRPHPERMTGLQRCFWLVIDRLCVLSAERVPGRLKWLFLPSALPPREPEKHEGSGI